MVRLYHTLHRLYLFPLKHKVIFSAILLFLFLIVFLLPFVRYIPQTTQLARGFLFGSVGDLESTHGRTNFLILGLGGAKNEPSSLTDTQQLFSYDHSDGRHPDRPRHLLLSVPRDIWLPELGLRINSAYAYGNSMEGSGIDLTKGAITEITGQPIHYSVMISFDGFVKLVDLFGGIDVDVERSFTDTRYPIPGRENDLCDGDPEYQCRWETISFQAGMNHFDGQTVLKFVRSRQSRGDEGTDFARAARQQKVMLAIKNKLLSPRFFLNSRKIEELLSLTEEVFESDIPQKDLGVVLRAFLEAKRERVYTQTLPAIDPTNPDENLGKPALLIHPPTNQFYKNQWVLVPIGGNWQPTHKWVACLLERDDCPVVI